MKRPQLRALVSAASESRLPILRVTTASMRPFIREGDLLGVERCGHTSLRPGDVVIFERSGRMWAHRLLGRTLSGKLIVKGDARLGPDAPLHPGAVLGKARYAMRGARRIELASGWARAKGALGGFALPAARVPGRAAAALWRRAAWRWRGRIGLRIAGVDMAVTPPGREIESHIRVVAAGHITPPRPHAVRLAVRQLSELPDADTAGGSSRDGGILRIWAPGLRMAVDCAAGSAEAVLDGSHLDSAIPCMLRNVATEFAFGPDCAVLHASCAVRGGEAIVFAGPSGAGKTTCAAMLADSQKMLDDLVFVGLGDDGAFVLPSPDFGRGGEGLSGSPVRLGAVLVLSLPGSEQLQCERLSGAAAVAAVAALPGPASSGAGAGASLAAAHGLASRVPVARLAFGLGADELESALEGL